MSTALIIGLTLLAWNAVFLLFGGTGVLLPIAAVATLLGALTLRAAGAPTRRRWFARPGPGVAIGALLGLALAAASWAAWWVRGVAPVDITPDVQALYATLRLPPGPVRGLPLMLLTITAEEIIFRGLLLDTLRARLGGVGAVGVGAFIYAAANLGSGTWILPVVALLLGAGWGALAERSRGLWVPLACHCVWDIIVFSIAPLVPP